MTFLMNYISTTVYRYYSRLLTAISGKIKTQSAIFLTVDFRNPQTLSDVDFRNPQTLTRGNFRNSKTLTNADFETVTEII